MIRFLKSAQVFHMFIFVAMGLLLSCVLPAAQAIDDYQTLLDALTPRNIGPAIMGGRTVDFAVVESNSSIIYAAVGPSGLWKSTDNGIHWDPVFEHEGSVSIGAVAVSRSHPDVVWVGTGEATCRNSVAIGDGVYKSMDGGKTWKNMGLTDTRHIDRILIDPMNPNIVYVGAMGHLWGANKERGLFKTYDGGKTWKNILYFDDNTGIADMDMDPSNSLIIYAAAYNHRRLPYLFTSGGPYSGLYKSSDGGETWKPLNINLPTGINGRCGISVCRHYPDVVYALIENKNGGLFRSTDKGETWTRACDKKTYDLINFRPFYYSKVTADPNFPEVVYVYSGRAYVSHDSGKTFSEIGQSLHADHHRIWVDPSNSNHLIDGNDGGIDISWDRGKRWYPVENAILSEVYQVTYDMRSPYYVYVGLQDNGSWAGPVNSGEAKGILNSHWYPVGGGDGFYTQVNPKNHVQVYRNLQMGNIEYFNQENGQTLAIKPQAGLTEEPYRFNWNAPIMICQHNPQLLYFGGNYLFRSKNSGLSWEKVSPDLSTQDPKKIIDSGGPVTPDNTGAEVHCTIYTLSQSPRKQGIIWAGTDDGNLWVTRDNCANWENVTQNIKGLPPNSWVSRVEASNFDEGGVFVTFDRHNSDDYAPYIYRSLDYGKTWQSLRANLPPVGYLHVVRQDYVNKNLLFVGSEFGLFVSFDGGLRWYPYKKDFPTIAVRDIAIHPRENDLIIGTHGRGVWIIDDITPWQRLTPEVLSKVAYLCPLRDTPIIYMRKSFEYYTDPYFAAPNPPAGVPISYYLKESLPPDKPQLLNIYDSEGTLLRTLEGTGLKGLNRIYWDMRAKPVFKKLPDLFKGDLARWYGLPVGYMVKPGQYKITLDNPNEKIFKIVELYRGRGITTNIIAWEENNAFISRLNRLLNQGISTAGALLTLSQPLQTLGSQLQADKNTPQPLLQKFTEITQKLSAFNTTFALPDENDNSYRKPLKEALRGGSIPEIIFQMQMSLNQYPGAPTEMDQRLLKEIEQKAQLLFQQVQDILNTDLPLLNKLLRESNRDYIVIPTITEI